MKTPLSLVYFLTGIFLLGWLSACSRAEPQPTPTPRVEIIHIEVTATPRATATSTTTPTRTASPTPTPTPTPTALPITIMGDPMASLIIEPISQPGALCGFVDYFDFPIDPPDAELGRGGGDFGVYRSRYQSNHAGEDWGYQTGDNLGQPVYVIGHGMVTYSQPYGWGLDQGTVIVKHTYRNGRVVYSFYGHLDPPSVVLRPGDCLVRGETVGNIGDPSGRPHLHFEIRLHNPDTPGPGYWSVDPTLAGWLPPSRTIWENRMSQQPGAVWTRFPAEGSQFVGVTDELLFVIEEGELRALNLADGRVIWRMELETSFPSVLLAAEVGLIYLADPLGHLEALTLPTPEMMAEWNNTKVVLKQAWEQELGVNGSPTLLPLPSGDVVMALRQTTVAFSVEGDRLWEAEGMLAISDWVLDTDRVVFSIGGETPALWVATETGLELLAEGVGGQLAETEGQMFVYDREGVYKVDASGDVSLVYGLAQGSGMGHMVSRPEGGVLIVHPDLAGPRLLAFDVDGRLVWERALKGIEGGQPRVVRAGEMVFLLTEESGSGAIIHLYQVDGANFELVQVFKGGTRTPIRQGTWMEALNSAGLLIQIGGGHMVWFVRE